MNLLYSFLCFILFFTIYVRKNVRQTDIRFMSMDYTQVLRGVAILMVMQQHLSGFVFGSRVFTPFGGQELLFS